jgi:hypothetical protein
MVREVRSPWNTTGNEPQRGVSPGSRSSPSNAADSGHLVRSPGKGPAVRRDSAVAVQGGEGTAHIEQTLDRGIRR